MARPLIEVFVEKNCRACEQVLGVLQSSSTAIGDVDLRVFDRAQDMNVFRQRGVLICPATFVNKKLVFYGSFSGRKLRHYLQSTIM